MAHNTSIVVESIEFLRVRKAWWLAPVITILLIAGIIIVLSQSSVISPFVYAFF